jgi:hypothetical protein
MIRRTAVMVLLLLVSVAMPLAAGTLSGSTPLWIEFDPLAGAFDALDLGFEVDYTLGDVVLSTDGLLVLPATWVWQGFSAVGRLGGYTLTANVLFGPSTTDYLYAEAIVELTIDGIDTAWHAAQLSDTALGGPADGWAVRIAGSVPGFDLVSITEFGRGSRTTTSTGSRLSTPRRARSDTTRPTGPFQGRDSPVRRCRFVLSISAAPTWSTRPPTSPAPASTTSRSA